MCIRDSYYIDGLTTHLNLRSLALTPPQSYAPSYVHDNYSRPLPNSQDLNFYNYDAGHESRRYEKIKLFNVVGKQTVLCVSDI